MLAEIGVLNPSSRMPNKCEVRKKKNAPGAVVIAAMTTAHGKSLVAHGRQGWLEIGAIDSYEKMDLCMRLIIGLLP